MFCVFRMSVKRKADIVFESGLPLDTFSIQWKINNFSAYLSDYLTCLKSSESSSGRVLESREFSTNSGQKWQLAINKWLISTRDQTYEIGFWIRLLSSHESMVNVNVECSIDINGQKHATKTSHFCDVVPKKAVMLLRTGKEELINLLNAPNSENFAVIEVNIEVWSEETVAVSHATSSESLERVPKKITKLWSDQTLTDITLQCQGKKFEAHKLILAASSPVFEVMFKEDATEHEDASSSLYNCVNIEDIDSDVFELFLRYLYTGQVDQLDEKLTDIFPVADKYDVQPLREICIQHMAEKISVDNAVDILSLAGRYDVENIKLQAQKFITNNMAGVMKTDSWASLLGIYSKIAKETIQQRST